MLSQVYYLLRSKADGSYVVARLNSQQGDSKNSNYLLIFNESFDALIYLNTHGNDIRESFAVESIAGNQLGNLMQRWGFTGVGIVQDPLLPKVNFLVKD
ncbi:MAG: hypothetical protein KME01_05955 [Chroococcus sp. CMT-3BRIN-NPC107]|jgi:hypothetical protein|nr:hypothetical protein [Chroococcus sp. CMT-3BRIN-NPC107]